MGISLDAFDVFSASAALEDQGVVFYGKAASRASGDGRRLLEGLSAMERNHGERFRNILRSMGRERPAGAGDPGEETDAYLGALTSDRIFTSLTNPLPEDSYGEILEKAILVEKNSVFFYTAVKETLESRMDSREVERLIQEELEHFRSLTEALRAWRARNGEV